MIKRYIAPLIVLILVAVISGLVWTKAPEFKGYILPTAVGILVFVGLIWALFPKIKRYMMPAIILILVVAVAGGLVWFNFFRDSHDQAVLCDHAAASCAGLDLYGQAG